MNKSPWSLRLCQIKGTTVQIHLSLFVLLFWLLLERPPEDNNSLLQPFLPLAILLTICLQGLGCVVVSRFLGMSLADLTLYPFGLIYSPLGETGQHKQFALAASVPAISALLAGAILKFIDPETLNSLKTDNTLLRLFIMQIFLTVLNLMPILPLAGGRLFKALLKIMQVKKAHDLMAKVGPFAALTVALVASASGDPVFIYVAAVTVMISLQIMLQHNAKALIEGCSVENAMIPANKIEVFQHGTSLSLALEKILTSMQDSFPVVVDRQLIGILDKEKLLRAAAFSDNNSYISEHMEREFLTVTPEDPLERALEIFELSKVSLLPVVKNGHLMGALFRSKLYEFMLVRNIKKRPKDQTEEISPWDSGEI